MAIVAEGKRGRIYLSPDEEQEKIAKSYMPEDYPDGYMPNNPRWFSPPMFGMEKYSEIFTARQLTALTTFSNLVSEAQILAEKDAIDAGVRNDHIPLSQGGTGALAYGQAVGVYLAFIEDRMADKYSSLCVWNRIGEKIEILNQFVQEKEIPSKLTTELYVIDDCLERAIKALQPKSADTDIDALEESFLQQRHLLIEARGRMQQEVKDIYTTAASQIREYGLDAANLLVDGCKQEDVEEELQKYVRLADDVIEKCQGDAVEVIDARLNEMGQELEVIENSEFSRNLKTRLSGKFDGLPEGIKRIMANASPGFQKAGQAVLNNAYKAGAQGGLKLTNFSGSTIHQMVLKVGHTINFKFKPWQAIKITKGIAIGGQVLSALGVGLSVFMQVKADQDEDRIREDLRKNRQNVRSQFNTAANELENYARQYIKDNVNRPLETSISVIDGNIQEIRGTRADRSNSCRELERLQRECQYLIQDIHSERVS